MICDDIQLNYNAEENSYELRADVPGSNVTWYYRDSGDEIDTGNEISIPVEGEPRSVTVCAVYELDGCYQTCCITFWLGNPYDCDYIFYDFNEFENGFDLTFTGTGNQLTWYNDSTGEELEADNNNSVFIPFVACKRMCWHQG